jgi:dihydrofolate synthase/folylpolyglutamate synthase
MDRPVVVGPVAAEPLAALRAEAEAAGAQFLPAEPARGDASGFAWGDFTDLKLNLPGRHQLENASVALEVLWALAVRGYPWPEEALRVGLAAASHPGRLERMAGKPPVLLDGAHNPPALRALADYLRENEGERKLAVVLALAKEKDPEQALEILAPLGAEFFFTVFSNPRSLPLSRWREVAEARGLRGA